MTLEISRPEILNPTPPSRNPAAVLSTVLSNGSYVTGRRPRTRIPLVSLSAGIREANSLFESGKFLDAFDVYEQLVVAHPEHSIELLAELYDLYQALPNREDRYTLYQARLLNFGIDSSDKVLDVGSGNIPFPLATHLADLSPDDDHYGRAGAPLRRIDGKPLYVCDIENLNCFADKEFDFVYCSHVLEHVRNPERACSELSRIGKRGYIETPTRGKDLWLNTAKISNHLWSVESYQAKLVFTEYRPEETEGLQNDLLMKMHVKPETPREKALTSLLYLKADLVNTMLLWEEKLECEVRRSFPFGSPIDRASKPKAAHSGPPKSSSTQQLKIYADRGYLPPGTKHTPLLVPLWGDIDSEGDPDWLRFKNFQSAGQEYFVQSDMTDADIVILPGDWTHCRHEAHRLAEVMAGSSKPYVIFFINDSEEPIGIEHSTVFRTSGRRSKRRPNEFGMPAWSVDFKDHYFGGQIQTRKKGSKPVIGFCGLVPQNEANVRSIAVDTLSASGLVTTNFIVRNEFWAGVLRSPVGNVQQVRREYAENIAGSDYVLCVRGAGNFSYRLYETLSSGRIPVFVDTDCLLPFEKHIDWKNHCVWVHANELSSIGEKVAQFHSRLSPDEFIHRQQACRELWVKWLSPEGFFANFHRHFTEAKTTTEPKQGYPLTLHGPVATSNPAFRLDGSQDQALPSTLAAPSALHNSHSLESKSARSAASNIDTSAQDTEADVCHFLRSVVQKGWTCVDVGANVGSITAILAECVGPTGRVLAFEAHPENARALRENMKSKSYAARVRVGNLAITDGKRSRIPLYAGRRNSPYEWNIVGHDVDGKPTDPVMTIAAAKLDTFFAKGSPLDLVKIDVEGAAGSVFEGMARLLREVSPMLLIEFHDQAEWEARTQLFEIGYALWDLNGRKLDATTDTQRLYHCLAMPSERSPRSDRNLSRFQVGETLSKPSCLFVNTYYTRFLDQYYERHNTLAHGSYAVQKDSIQRQLFGDCDFYSQGLQKAGWVAEDVIANCLPMQQSWARENGQPNSSATTLGCLLEQIKQKQPSVVYFQDLSLASSDVLGAIRPFTKLIVGQIASPVPRETDLAGLDLIFSSFPHFVERFRNKGLTAYYQPLAFDPRVLKSLPSLTRHYPVTFVGGLSAVHGKGTAFLERLADLIPMDFWGYGVQTLGPTSPIRLRHHDEAWGIDMFSRLSESFITVNRHIDVAENYANNMRLFEATGCGALLVTDYKDNLNELFEIGKEVVAYRSPEECAALIKYYLAHPDEAREIAQAGQTRTLHEHTYVARMEQTAEILSRHLRYRSKEGALPVPDLSMVSYGHTQIRPEAVDRKLTSAWQSNVIPLKQRALVQQELERMYQGRVPDLFQVLANCLKPYLFNGCTVLETGCASGYYYEVLEYLSGKRIRYTGVDYSEPLIAMAKAHYQSVRFEVADGSRLPFKDREFDIVASGGVLLHVPNYAEHIAESCRVAKRIVVAHRTPVCRNTSTRYLKKFGYGVEMVELVFNEDEILSIFAANGMELLRSVETASSTSQDEYGMTYVFQRR